MKRGVRGSCARDLHSCARGLLLVLVFSFQCGAAAASVGSLTADDQGNLIATTGAGKFLVDNVDVLNELRTMAASNAALKAQVDQLQQAIAVLQTTNAQLQVVWVV